MNARNNRLLSGAVILMVAGMLSKVLSAMYRIPLQNLTGDLGFYLYQQIYPLVAIVMVVSLYGFPTAIATLTAEKNEWKEPITYRNHFGPIFIILLISCTGMAIFLFIFAPVIASFIQDDSLTVAFQLGALLFLVIPFLALYRGILQAYGEMKQTAISQLLEQTIRVIVIVFVAIWIFQNHLHVTSIATAGVIASLIGMMIAIVYLTISFVRKFPINNHSLNTDGEVRWGYYIRTLLLLGIFATINHVTFILLQIVDVLTLVPHLMKAGLPPLIAMEEKGVFDRGVPLIQVGVVIGSSFAVALIPAISKRQWRKHFQRIQEGIALSFYLAFGAMIGLIVMMPLVNTLFFMDRSGTGALQLLSIVVLFLSITITGITILQTTGNIKRAGGYLLMIICMKGLLNVLFVPIWGIFGSSVATVISLGCLTILVLLELKRTLNVPFMHVFGKVHWIALIKASSAMIIFLLVCEFFVHSEQFSRTNLLLYTLSLVGLGALIFMMMLLRNGALSNEQIRALPISRGLFFLQQIGRKQNGG